MEGTLGVVTCFAGDFQPRLWAFCNGQTLAISTNQALFSILGTTYGGNGTTTFMLPDLRGRAVAGTGSFQGQQYSPGQVLGAEQVTLAVNNLPPHTHDGAISLSLQADSDDASLPSPDFSYPAKLSNAYSNTTPNVVMQAPAYQVVINATGSSQQAFTRSPFLAVNHIICLQGLYPSRN